MAWAVYEGEVPVLKALRSVIWLEDDGMVEKQECERHEWGHGEHAGSPSGASITEV